MLAFHAMALWIRWAPLAAALCVLWASAAECQDQAPETAEEAPAAETNEAAETGGNDVDDAARLLFSDGSRAFDAGDFELALDRFLDAYDLSQRDALLYNIALCHDRLDHRTEALDYYDRFLEAVPEAETSARARARADVLRRSQAAQAQEEAEATPRRRNLAGPIAAFAVAGAGLITLAIAGPLTIARHSSAEDDCNAGACVRSDLDAVDRSALVADIGLAVALAGAATGTLWLLLGRDSGPEVAALPGGATLGYSGQF